VTWNRLLLMLLVLFNAFFIFRFIIHLFSLCTTQGWAYTSKYELSVAYFLWSGFFFFWNCCGFDGV